MPLNRARLVAGAMVLVLTALAGAQGHRTVWDGVYTEEQAKRGAGIYAQKCGACHGDALGGIESAPALTGSTFYANWEGESLNALFERIRTSMPQDRPASLSRAQNADIVAHILRAGGYPAGAMPLEGQPGTLSGITVLTYKP